MEPSTTSDAELLARSRAGDAKAFSALVRRNQSSVFAVALATVGGDRSLAEDAAQDAFVVAWRRLDRLNDSDALRPWLCGIARNRARHLVRSHARRSQRHERHAAEAAQTAPSPRDELLARQAEESLGDLIRRIPPRYREALSSPSARMAGPATRSRSSRTNKQK